MLTTRDGSTQNRAGWIVAAIAFAVPLCLLALRDVQIRPNTSLRLADNDPIRLLAAEQREQLSQPESLLVTWDGSTCNDPRIALFSESLLGQMDADGIRRGGAPEVAAVTTPRDMLKRLAAQEIDADESLGRLTGTFIGRGALKVVLTDAGRESQSTTTDRLVRAIREQLGIDLRTTGPVDSWASSESAEDAGTAPEINEHDLQITWDGFHPQSTTMARVRAQTLALTDFPTAGEPDGRKLVQDCFVAPGSPIGIRIDLSPAGAADAPASLAAIDRAAAAADIPQIHVVGESVSRAEHNAAQRRAIWNPAASAARRSLPLLAVLIVAVITCCTLRNVSRGAVLLTLMATAGVLGMALLRPLGSQVESLLLAAPLLAVLLVLAGGLGIAQDRPDSNGTAGSIQTFRLATIIVAIVLSPLMISSTPVIRQLGMTGVICTGLALVLGASVLPTLLRQLGGDRPTFRGVNGRWLSVAGVVTQRPRLTGALCGLLLIAGAAGMGRLSLETGDFFAATRDSRLAADTRFVADNLSGTSALDIIVRFDATSGGGTRFLERAEIVRAAEQAVLRNPAITGAYSLADLLPETELPPPGAPTRTRVDFNRKSNKVEDHVRSGAIPDADRLLFTSTNHPVPSADASEAPDSRTSERWRISAQAVLPEGGGVLQVTEDLNQAIQQVLRRHPGTRHEIAGAAVFADAARRIVLRSLTKTSVLACLVLMGALIWIARTPAAMLIGMLVNILPIVAVLGLATIKGLRIEEQVLTTALLGLLVGAHGAIQLLLRFRDCIQQGESHGFAARRALAQCGPGSVRFAAVAVAALLVLSRSELVALGRMGGLLAGMIAATQLTTLVLLPSLLAGRIGLWIERSQRVPASAGPGATTDATPSPHVRFEPAARDVVRSAV